ncbi:MAG: RluA family pseudouridine synthase [Candidatus Pelagibacter sp. TMED153]|mgnify:CR=1 FL=1|nr:MAG: RluA family pseudouridine synthase [Candidatus Pelagibacter sp. TMED153]|tara:strand:- start:472 stop:1380 length:909 start_codon:yes stop_codon:yes gene_type:complete
MPKTYTVEKNYQNSRFDKWFKANIINIPQSLIEKIIRLNKVKINRKKVKSSYRVQFGDIVDVYDIARFKANNKPKLLKYKPSKKELSSYENYIIENNENFVVINKPAGIPVQSGTKSFKNIIDLLKDTKYFKNQKPYIVHRLDKETSGILIVAKTREYAQLFTSLFRIRKIHKTYVALTYGKISKSKDTLKDNLISYDKNKKIIQKAISHLKVLKFSNEYSYVELNPITGRKHQLRKQLYNIGNPIVGDNKYFINRKANKRKKRYNNLMLHAYKIKFIINNIQYNFKANYNKNFEDFLKSEF